MQLSEIKTLKIDAGVRYWEDAIFNDLVANEDGSNTPFKHGDYWTLQVNVKTGEIINWPIGTYADIHYKVCDNGSYYLIGEDGKVIYSLESEYVPSCLCPLENGFGDYIIFKVDQFGKIEGWMFDESDLKEFS